MLFFYFAELKAVGKSAGKYFNITATMFGAELILWSTCLRVILKNCV